jgi:hypothetical protein
VSPSTSQPRAGRSRVERVIGVLAPGLDLVLAVGERISRVAGRHDPDYYAARTLPPESSPLAARRERAGR